MERRGRGRRNRINPSLVAQLQDLQQQYDGDEEESYSAGYRQGIEDAIGLAELEELRVRGLIESHDGTCLDEEEERRRFIQDLYGGEEIDTTDRT